MALQYEVKKKCFCHLFSLIHALTPKQMVRSLTQVGYTSEHRDGAAVLKLTEMVHPHHASFVSAD